MWQPVSCCLRKKLNVLNEEMQCLRKEILVHGKHSAHNLFSEESHTCAQNLVVSERNSSYSRLESCLLGCNSAGKKVCQHARNISEESCYNGRFFPNQEMEGVKILLPVNPWYIWWGNSLVSLNLPYAVLRTMEVLKCKMPGTAKADEWFTSIFH